MLPAGHRAPAVAIQTALFAPIVASHPTPNGLQPTDRREEVMRFLVRRSPRLLRAVNAAGQTAADFARSKQPKKILEASGSQEGMEWVEPGVTKPFGIGIQHQYQSITGQLVCRLVGRHFC